MFCWEVQAVKAVYRSIKTDQGKLDSAAPFSSDFPLYPQTKGISEIHKTSIWIYLESRIQSKNVKNCCEIKEYTGKHWGG